MPSNDQALSVIEMSVCELVLWWLLLEVVCDPMYKFWSVWCYLDIRYDNR